MKKSYNYRTKQLFKVELDPGEQQYLSSYNLKNIAPEAHAKVKAQGAKRWRERRSKATTNIDLPLKDACIQEC